MTFGASYCRRGDQTQVEERTVHVKVAARQPLADEHKEQHSGRVTDASRRRKEEDEDLFQQQLSLALLESEAEARANDARNLFMLDYSTVHIMQKDAPLEELCSDEVGMQTIAEDVKGSTAAILLNTAEPEPDVQCSGDELPEVPIPIANTSPSFSQQDQSQIKVPAEGTMLYEQRVAYIPEQLEGIKAVCGGPVCMYGVHGTGGSLTFVRAAVAGGRELFKRYNCGGRASLPGR